MSLVVLDPLVESVMHSMSPSGLRLLGNLPYYYQTDPTAVTVLNVLGRELDRIETFLDTLRLQEFPQNADDTYRILRIWESELGMPVAPSQLTLAQRQARVIAWIRTRRVGAGFDWSAAVTQFFGSDLWTVEENTPSDYAIQVLIPHDASGGYTIAAMQGFLRAITPAHLDISVGYSGGFIVDISHVDQDVIE